MKPRERLEHVGKAAFEQLTRLGIPVPRAGFILGATDFAGEFTSSNWAIHFPTQTFANSGQKDMAAQAATVLHESEHLATTYVAAQYLAAANKTAAEIASELDIPVPVAEHAVKDPYRRRRARRHSGRSAYSGAPLRGQAASQAVTTRTCASIWTLPLRR
jgi:hypothetical protein